MKDKVGFTVDNGNATTAVAYDDKASEVFWGATFTVSNNAQSKEKNIF